VAVRLSAPTFSGNGGAFKLGRVGYSYPAGSRIAYTEGRRVAVVFVPSLGYVFPWKIHFLCEAGELLGIPAPIQLRAEREMFPSST
jgi:hypothetical protein